jgi:hypothetical protein
MIEARQFGKVYWDEAGSPAARIVAAYVRYRCHDGPKIILRSELQSVLGLSLGATKRAITEAVDAELVYRRPSRRPGDHNKQTYSIEPFTSDSDGSEMQPAGNAAGSDSGRCRSDSDGQKKAEAGQNLTGSGSEKGRGRPDSGPAHEGSPEQLKKEEQFKEEQPDSNSAQPAYIADPAKTANPHLVTALDRHRSMLGDRQQPTLPGLGGRVQHHDVEAEAPAAREVRTAGATPAQIREWWSEVYLPIRKRVFERWRPDASIRDVECSDARVKEIRVRLNGSMPNASWAEQRNALTHVVECAAEKVAEQKGAVVPWGDRTYDTMKNIAPEYWLKQSRFQELIESPVPSRATTTDATGSFERIAAPVYDPTGPVRRRFG